MVQLLNQLLLINSLLVDNHSLFQFSSFRLNATNAKAGNKLSNSTLWFKDWKFEPTASFFWIFVWSVTNTNLLERENKECTDGYPWRLRHKIYNTHMWKIKIYLYTRINRNSCFLCAKLKLIFKEIHFHELASLV